MNRLKQGGKFFLVLLGFALLTAYAVIFNNTSGWLLWLFYVGFILLNLVTLVFPLRQLQLTVPETFWTQAGTTFLLPVTVKSRGWFWVPAFSVSLPQHAQQPIFRSFYHGQRLTLNFPIEGLQRGIYPDLSVLVTAGDWFGLFQKSRKYVLPSELVVLPAVDESMAQFVPRLRKEQQMTLFGERTAEIRNHREYHRGDSLKQIDWKLTARSRQLMIREYQEKQESPVVFIFWGEAGPFFETQLRAYFNVQQQLAGLLAIQQYLVTAAGGEFLQGDRVFAAAKGFEQKPELFAFKNKTLLVFTGSSQPDTQLTAQIADWERTNQVKLYDLVSLSHILKTRTEVTATQEKTPAEGREER